MPWRNSIGKLSSDACGTPSALRPSNVNTIPNQPGNDGTHHSSAGATWGRIRRSISRPCSALPMRRMTYSPQYGLGRGRKTVACMSLVSSAGERVERVSPADSLRDNMRASFQGSGPFRTGPQGKDQNRLRDLVEELVERRTDFLEPFQVPDGEVGLSNIPGAGRDLVLCDVILHGGATDARPPFAVAEHHVELIGNMRGEVVDIRVPLAVICRREQDPRVVVEEHVAHIMHAADPVGGLDVEPRVQHRLESLCSSRRNWEDDGEFGDLAAAQSGTAGARCFFRVRNDAVFHAVNEVFESDAPDLRCISVELPELLDFLLSLGFRPRQRLRCHGDYSPFD